MPDDAIYNEIIIAAANVPLFLYPFLNTTSKTRPFEYLRLTSLGVIGALVKVLKFHSMPQFSLNCMHSEVVRDTAQRRDMDLNADAAHLIHLTPLN